MTGLSWNALITILIEGTARKGNCEFTGGIVRATGWETALQAFGRSKRRPYRLGGLVETQISQSLNSIEMTGRRGG